ncbi:autorepressor SdpR family transcription factor [Domibacillus sp. DTU_2020_1001157_1_SI_ALB_TIR_016]|uniref:autorepressor SdpR family transcription factor n=1 Tax=Domibacillus sp. DTU_2020_1001157_1_SI_ALB_TIR_016 TaxID=3077789 RepID=UPI0028E33DB1|nr:autorepressor SdpR family transcription factor [Domibacillus sp. DTU_2020_1001157_1_SI_ALB_TIR_016]WNS80178.1 autorepressor SdpR family transcription factor [Domibacillus sp. DTU_2020_1001157_1_SI_ALB_TIR_016]
MSATLVFKALSDPTRRSIIELLKKQDMTAGDIAEHFQMTKPSISHHLHTLQNAGLVLSERKGQHIIYSLNTTVFQDIVAWMLTVSGKEKEK